MKSKKSFVLLLVLLTLPLLLPATGAAGDINFTVVFRSSTLPENATGIVENAGGRIIGVVPEIGLMRIEGPMSLLESLGSDPEIQAINPSLILSMPSEPQAAIEANASFDTSEAFLYEMFEWDIKQVTNDGASFDICPGSHQTVVGVIDTGINTQHQDLSMNILGGYNFVPDPVDGVVYPDDYEDPQGHGTICAGEVAAHGLTLGVGPNLGIRAYRVLDVDGNSMIDWITDGMVAAADDGVDVISMSMGFYFPIAGYSWSFSDGTGLKATGHVAEFLAWKRAAQYVTSRGVVIVAAAGNDSDDYQNPRAVSDARTDQINEEFEQLGIGVRIDIQGATRHVPATLPGVLNISATDRYDNPTSYTNYGLGYIDLSAPAGDFLSDPPQLTDLCLVTYIGAPNAYAFAGGTSVATPKVAAVAALIIDQAKAMGESLNPAQVISRLKKSAIDAGKPGRDEFYGFGMVNAVSALEE